MVLKKLTYLVLLNLLSVNFNMKTLLFTLEYPPFKGGVANYYGNLAKYWLIEEKLVVLDNTRKELMSSTSFLSWLPSISVLNRKLAKDKIDYLLVGQILPLGTAAYLVSFFKKIDYAVILHGMDFALAIRTPWKRFLSGLILKRANKIICANSYVQEKLIEFSADYEEKVELINPGIEGGAPDISPNDIQEIKKTYNLEGKTVLLSLGRLVKRKGFDKVIETLINLPQESISNLIYFIAGSGPREEYLKSLVPLRYSKKIIFLGALSDYDKWAWLKICDIFIMPSRDIAGDFEGFGIVYLEANLCGKPVIAGNSGGVKDAVSDGVSGLMVEPEDLDSIALAISRLSNDKDLRDKLGSQGKERAIREFSWENQAADLCKFIKE